jgi:hypothetical protein
MNAYGIFSWDISRIMAATWSISHIAVVVIQNGVVGGLTINGVLVAVGSLWPITRIQKQILAQMEIAHLDE